MKYLLLFLLLPFVSTSQEKKDSKVIVIAKDTSNLFRRVAAFLQADGYSFEQKDEVLQFIATGEKQMPRSGGSGKLRASIKDSTVTITGLVAADSFLSKGDTKTFEPVSYKGMKGSLNMKVWNEMLALARELGEQISYSK